MMDRYSKPEMAALFTDEAMWEACRLVEVHAVMARSRLGEISEDDAHVVWEAAPRVTPEIVALIQEREKTTDHDVAAFVDVMGGQIGHEAARHFHAGLTSSDVTDTGLCYRLSAAAKLLEGEVEVLLQIICAKARQYARTPTAGRTHGQHAEIITFGVRLTNWALMLERALFRLAQARKGISVGKLSGACGTYTNIDPQVEKDVCESLGLTPIVATQVVPRDLHEQLMAAVAGVGNAIGHMSLTLRVMASTEFNEVEEGRRRGQKGSSAMPHKHNPIKNEQFDGLARLLRAYHGASAENVELFFERDISHSAPERIALKDGLVLCHYLVVTTRTMFERLVVNEERMWDNISRTNGLMFSQTLLTALLGKGMQRDDAYRLVQGWCEEVLKDGEELSVKVNRWEDSPFSPQEVDEIFDAKPMLRNCGLIIQQLPR